MASWTAQDTRDFLAESELFNILPDGARAGLARKVTVRVVPASGPILHRGESGDSLFVIGSGSVRVTLDAPSGEKEVSVLRKFDFFGEIAMMTRAHRTANITAIEETTLLEFAGKDILPLTETYSEFKTRIARIGAQRSADSLEKMIEE